MGIYCNNDPCEAEATRYFDVPGKGGRIYLCETCSSAFEWGQERPDVGLKSLDEAGCEGCPYNGNGECLAGPDDPCQIEDSQEGGLDG